MVKMKRKNSLKEWYQKVFEQLSRFRNELPNTERKTIDFNLSDCK